MKKKQHLKMGMCHQSWGASPPNKCWCCFWSPFQSRPQSRQQVAEKHSPPKSKTKARVRRKDMPRHGGRFSAQFCARCVCQFLLFWSAQAPSASSLCASSLCMIHCARFLLKFPSANLCLHMFSVRVLGASLSMQLCCASSRCKFLCASSLSKFIYANVSAHVLAASFYAQKLLEHISLCTMCALYLRVSARILLNAGSSEPASW